MKHIPGGLFFSVGFIAWILTYFLRNITTHLILITNQIEYIPSRWMVLTFYSVSFMLMALGVLKLIYIIKMEKAK